MGIWPWRLRRGKGAEARQRERAAATAAPFGDSPPAWSTQQVLQLADGAATFRCVYRLPVEEARGTCLIVPSEFASSYDEPTPENLFYGRLTTLLAEQGVGTIRFDLERLPDPTTEATPPEITARLQRLERILASVELQPLLGQPVLLGTSLGAAVVLRALATPDAARLRPAGLVLIGCLMSEPPILRVSPGPVALVYGSEDPVIPSAGPEGSQEGPPRPSRPATVRLLTSVLGESPAVHLVPDMDRTLQPVAEGIGIAEPVALVAGLILERCRAS